MDFWLPKLERNRERDAENIQRLKELGWEIMVIWECEINKVDQLKQRIKDFLG